jgi:hypothetical protein
MGEFFSFSNSAVILRKIYEHQQKMVSVQRGREIPLEAWAGPEGFRTFRLAGLKKIDTLRW